jgi:hypothetical protein
LKATLLVLAAATACTKAATPIEPTTACVETAHQLRAFIVAVRDPARPVARPWPTGDAARDRRIDDVLRSFPTERDPAAPAPTLTEGTKPGLLERELAKCPPALELLAQVSTTEPANAREAWANIANGLAACDCRADLAMLRVAFYLEARGR